jgi:hypothetical protein
MTSAQFKEAMPAFASADDLRIAYWLGLDDNEKPVPEVWGALYLRGITNWAAHQLVMEGATGADAASAGGDAAFSRMKVGQVEVQKSDRIAELAAEDDFLATRYGRMFRQLQLQVGRGAAVA